METRNCAGDQTLDTVTFRRSLIAWGREHFRVFPWRLTRDPYRILMAEVMLHRTQVAQVLPVYVQFVEHYPTLQELARANSGELNRILSPLGLHWRIRLMADLAADIESRFDGQIPMKRQELVTLPGVSEYIAGAMRCFAWGFPEALLDTNTVRVIGRVSGIELKDSLRRNSKFRSLVASLVDPDEPGTFNYALLDLAGQICTKRHPPQCRRCPVLQHCSHGRGALMDPQIS